MLTSWHYLFSCYLLWVAATTKQRESLLLMNEGVAGVFSGCQTFYGGALSVTHISTPIITIFNLLILFRRYYMFSSSSFGDICFLCQLIFQWHERTRVFITVQTFLMFTCSYLSQEQLESPRKTNNIFVCWGCPPSWSSTSSFYTLIIVISRHHRHRYR